MEKPKETSGKFVVFALIAIVLAMSGLSVLAKKWMKEKHPKETPAAEAAIE